MPEDRVVGWFSSVCRQSRRVQMHVPTTTGSRRLQLPCCRVLDAFTDMFTLYTRWDMDLDLRWTACTWVLAWRLPIDRVESTCVTCGNGWLVLWIAVSTSMALRMASTMPWVLLWMVWERGCLNSSGGLPCRMPSSTRFGDVARGFSWLALTGSIPLLALD